jgi:hypothetical protein
MAIYIYIYIYIYTCFSIHKTKLTCYCVPMLEKTSSYDIIRTGTVSEKLLSLQKICTQVQGFLHFITLTYLTPLAHA